MVDKTLICYYELQFIGVELKTESKKSNNKKRKKNPKNILNVFI